MAGWGNSDQDYMRYAADRNSFGQDMQTGYNLLSNPLAQIGLGTNDSLAANREGGVSGLTNPFNIDFTGGSGGWNAALAADKDVFQSMTEEDWSEFSKLTTRQQNAWVQKRKVDVKAGLNRAKDEASRKAKEAEYQKWRDDTMKKLSTFADNMNMSVDDLIKHGDVGMQANRNQANNLAAQRGAGLSGGISNMNSQRAVADAALKYQMGRQQMGQQAMGQLLNGLQTQYMNDEDRRRYEQGMSMQLQQSQAAANQQKYMQRQQQASGIMGLAGGIIGGIWGGQGGAQAGSSIGQAFGTMQYGSSNPYQPYQYQYPTGAGGGSGYGGGSNSGLSGAGGGYPKFGNSQ